MMKYRQTTSEKPSMHLLLFTGALADGFRCPFRHISLLIFEFVSVGQDWRMFSLSGYILNNTGQCWKMKLKRQQRHHRGHLLGPKWTTHSAVRKVDIRIRANHKQAPADAQWAFWPCFGLDKQRHYCDSVIADAAFEYGSSVSHEDKNKRVCGKSEDAHPVF